jgi:hypothetical protein
MLIGAIAFGGIYLFFFMLMSPACPVITTKSSCPSNDCLVLWTSPNSTTPVSVDWTNFSFSLATDDRSTTINTNSACPSNACLMKWSPDLSSGASDSDCDPDLPSNVHNHLEARDLVLILNEVYQRLALQQQQQQQVTCPTNNCLIAGFMTHSADTERFVPLQVFCSVPVSVSVVDVVGDLSTPPPQVTQESELDHSSSPLASPDLYVSSLCSLILLVGVLADQLFVAIL